MPTQATHHEPPAKVHCLVAAPAVAVQTRPGSVTMLVDRSTMQAFIANLRNGPDHITVTEQWQREEIADDLERLFGLEAPSDFKPYDPVGRLALRHQRILQAASRADALERARLREEEEAANKAR